MTIGEKLQARRKELKLTQENAAQQLHVSRQAISNWETSKNYPDLETIIAISDVYQISLDTLLKGDNLIVKEINKNIHVTIIKRGVAFLGLLSIIICLIIDLAISQRLTWSLIPTISLLALGGSWLSYEKLTSWRLLASATCMSLLLLPYLWLLEKILLRSGYITDTWFFYPALPTSILWLSILWSVALIHLKMAWHWCYSVALLCLISIGGSYLMTLILGDSDSLSLIITAISAGSVSLIFFLLGNLLSRSVHSN